MPERHSNIKGSLNPSWLEAYRTRSPLPRRFSIAATTGASDNHAGCFLVPEDNRTPDLLLTTYPFSGSVIPAVSLFSGEDGWVAYPQSLSFSTLSELKGCLCSINWIVSLATVVQESFGSALRLLKNAENPLQQKALEEFVPSSDGFHILNPLWDFPFGKRSIAWNAAIRWEEWDRLKLSPVDRCRDLKNFFKRDIALQTFHEACDAFGLKLKEGSARDTVTPDPTTYPIQPRPFSRVMDIPSSRASIGGPPGTIFEDPAIVRTLSDLPSGFSEVQLNRHLWWWRKMKDWEKPLRRTFEDNWERSAFIYEFGAREQNWTWHPFGTPWIHLGRLERGVLARLWPPRHDGGYRILPMLSERQLRHSKMIAHLDLQVDLAAPVEDLLARVRQWYKDQKERRSVREQSRPRRGRFPWIVLEYMDRIHFLREKMTNPQHGSVSKARRLYEKACLEADLTF